MIKYKNISNEEKEEFIKFYNNIKDEDIEYKIDKFSQYERNRNFTILIKDNIIHLYGII